MDHLPKTSEFRTNFLDIADKKAYAVKVDINNLAGYIRGEILIVSPAAKLDKDHPNRVIAQHTQSNESKLRTEMGLTVRVGFYEEHEVAYEDEHGDRVEKAVILNADGYTSSFINGILYKGNASDIIAAKKFISTGVRTGRKDESCRLKFVHKIIYVLPKNPGFVEE